MRNPNTTRAAFYLRVSTAGQTTENQRLQLQQVADARGWEIVGIFTDVASGARDDRPQLAAVMKAVRRGQVDLVAVQALDRLGRSSKHLIGLVDELNHLGVDLFSYRETVDTSSPMGRVILTVFSALAEFELAVLKERTCAGLERAKARGKILGRPRKDNVDVKRALELVKGGMSKKAVARELSVPRTSLLRALDRVSENVSENDAVNG